MQNKSVAPVVKAAIAIKMSGVFSMFTMKKLLEMWQSLLVPHLLR